MKRKARKLVLAMVALVFVGSCGMLARHLVQYRQGQEAYHEAAQLVEIADLPDVEQVPLAFEPLEPSAEQMLESVPAPVETVDPSAEALEKMDFTALREVNEDVLGWIVIPDTNLSYPLLQGTDNEYYLSHTWQKSRNAVGSIFVDHRNSSDLSDFHTIVYGHRMKDGSMFGQLHKYKNAAYWGEHPKIYLADDNGSHAYEVFSVYEADSLDTYQIEFADDGEKEEFLQYVTSRTWVNTGVIPEGGERILTLSTCTGNGHDTRWVVHAVLTE